ncbi:hypothetical protein [Candidatus Pyrohabitans sp.]
MKAEIGAKLTAVALMTLAVERLFTGSLAQALLLALSAVLLIHLSVRVRCCSGGG